MSFVTRFAPSPTGYLHLGHAYSALSAFDAARRENGVLLLRIEDIDRQRSRDEYEQALLEDLAWLGIAWPEPVRRQSRHLADYAAPLDRLIEVGAVYRCFKTRREVVEAIAAAPHRGLGEGPDGAVYVGDPEALSKDEAEMRIARGDAFAWRLSAKRCADILADRLAGLRFCDEGARPGEHAVDLRAIGDPVLARKDAGTSYHLACTHDDAFQGVSHVIRGVDLFEAAALHRVLQALLGWPTPVYRHHALVTNAAGRRLSKRDGAESLRSLREAGVSPAEVRARVGLSGA